MSASIRALVDAAGGAARALFLRLAKEEPRRRNRIGKLHDDVIFRED